MDITLLTVAFTLIQLTCIFGGKFVDQAGSSIIVLGTIITMQMFSTLLKSQYNKYQVQDDSHKKLSPLRNEGSNSSAHIQEEKRVVRMISDCEENVNYLISLHSQIEQTAREYVSKESEKRKAVHCELVRLQNDKRSHEGTIEKMGVIMEMLTREKREVENELEGVKQEFSAVQRENEELNQMILEKDLRVIEFYGEVERAKVEYTSKAIKDLTDRIDSLVHRQNVYLEKEREMNQTVANLQEIIESKRERINELEFELIQEREKTKSVAKNELMEKVDRIEGGMRVMLKDKENEIQQWESKGSQWEKTVEEWKEKELLWEIERESRAHAVEQEVSERIEQEKEKWEQLRAQEMRDSEANKLFWQSEKQKWEQKAEVWVTERSAWEEKQFQSERDLEQWKEKEIEWEKHRIEELMRDKQKWEEEKLILEKSLLLLRESDSYWKDQKAKWDQEKDLLEAEVSTWRDKYNSEQEAWKEKYLLELEQSKKESVNTTASEGSDNSENATVIEEESFSTITLPQDIPTKSSAESSTSLSPRTPTRSARDDQLQLIELRRKIQLLLQTKIEMEEKGYLDLSPSPHTPPSNSNTSNKINDLRKMLEELEHEMASLGYPLPKEITTNRSLDILKTFSLPVSPLSHTPSITPPLTTPSSPRDPHQQTQTQTQAQIQEHTPESPHPTNHTTQSLSHSTPSLQPHNISNQTFPAENNEQPSHPTKAIHSPSSSSSSVTHNIKNLHAPTRNDFTNTLSLNPQIYQPKYNTFMHELHDMHAKMKSVKGFLDLKTKNSESSLNGRKGFPLNRVGLGLIGNDLSRGRSRSFVGYQTVPRNLTPTLSQTKVSLSNQSSGSTTPE